MILGMLGTLVWYNGSMNYMIRFVGYFILEFAIVFLVAYGINFYFMHGTVSILFMIASSVAAGVAIAFALTATGNNKTCWGKKKSPL